MGYLEMFDQDIIEDVDPIENWIRDNNAYVRDTNHIPYQMVQLDLENDFRNDGNE
jgi:hypothetical protein